MEERINKRCVMRQRQAHMMEGTINFGQSTMKCGPGRNAKWCDKFEHTRCNDFNLCECLGFVGGDGTKPDEYWYPDGSSEPNNPVCVRKLNSHLVAATSSEHQNQYTRLA
ncbi:hypothetical protein RvY_17154 [Ramazzottius varieornatus]|uniref:Uncharacterized protein n=1 Tax=Ramazzottius varieornatus TaxID=947166 RepID=A0A1D1W151_RAMVA|nr:hypothetical protein RvY_17154 [Ramazzottius varieornatus]